MMAGVMKTTCSFLLIGGLFVVALASPVVPARSEETGTSLIDIDFSRPEPGEEYPGGAATSKKSTNNRNAFSHSSGNMPFSGELTFKLGNAMFRKVWVSAPASTKASDGLGPLYNARSCQRCHLKDGRGHPPEDNYPGDNAISMFLRLSIPPQTEEQKRLLAERKINVIPDPTYGGQLQDLAIQGHNIEGRMHITYSEKQVALSDGEVVAVRVPSYKITDFGYGAPHPEMMISPRVAPQMIGLGLLEAIPAEQILANADPDDTNGDGISGKASLVWSSKNGAVMLGRFGWKAGTPSVLEQGSGAFAGDIGISNPVAPHASGDCTAKQDTCLNAPNGNSERDGGHEIGKKLNDMVAFYSRNLAVPKRRNVSDPEVLEGKELFYNIGCVACHKPHFQTGIRAAGGKHLTNQKIWPYTDLLLHDMGDGLADHRPAGVATGKEWRTAPLWGIGLTKHVSGHSYFLHDGRARNVTEAILWHGGEAQNARDAFAGLAKSDREKLVAFVNSL